MKFFSKGLCQVSNQTIYLFIIIYFVTTFFLQGYRLHISVEKVNQDKNSFFEEPELKVQEYFHDDDDDDDDLFNSLGKGQEIYYFRDLCQISTEPYLSKHIWKKVVDNSASFYLEPTTSFRFLDYMDDDFDDEPQQLQELELEKMAWVDRLPSPVTILFKNDDQMNVANSRSFLIPFLTKANVKYVYMQNPPIIHPKIRPLPMGLPFDGCSDHMMNIYRNTANSTKDIKALFTSELNLRQDKIYLSNLASFEYGPKRSFWYNVALQTAPEDVCFIISDSSKDSVFCKPEPATALDIMEMKLYRFVACPPSFFSLDHNRIWEALLAGAIPIFPHSTLDTMFEDLPVWLVDSWEEVTPDAMKETHTKMLANTDSFNWDKILLNGWVKEIANQKEFSFNLPEMTKHPHQEFCSAPQSNCPQQLTFGDFYLHSSNPHLSADMWAEIVDNKHSFFVRPYEEGFPDKTEWISWLDSLVFPVTIVMNNNLAKSWPDLDNAFDVDILNHKNVKYLYVKNPLAKHGKIRPIPTGLKYQYEEVHLYGESKYRSNKRFRNIANSGMESKALFLSEDRTCTVFVRYMSETNNAEQAHYDTTANRASRTERKNVCSEIKRYAKAETSCVEFMLSQEEYFEQLGTHRFVAAPAGTGIDTHGVWEALLAGCIPIVPSSPIDHLYKDLPVWIIKNWREVSSKSIEKMENEFLAKKDTYQWDKIYVQGWSNELSRLQNAPTEKFKPFVYTGEYYPLANGITFTHQFLKHMDSILSWL